MSEHDVPRPGWLADFPEGCEVAREDSPAPSPTARPPKRDLAAVATVARQALADGKPLSNTVRAAFGVTFSRAGGLIMEARRAGHDIPSAPNARRVEYSRADVARVAIEAHALGQPMGRAVAAALSVSEKHASSLITLARTDGHPIPKGKGRKPVETAREFVGTSAFTFGKPAKKPAPPVHGPKAAAARDDWSLVPPRPVKPGPNVVGLADACDDDPATMLVRRHVTLDQVAAAYKATVIDGGKPITAIAQRWQVHRKVAQGWVCMCRETSPMLLPPRDLPQVPSEFTPGAVPRGTTVTAQSGGL